ncbi:hypothetical protein FSST1_000104 [Fusarium sambucinum]
MYGSVGCSIVSNPREDQLEMEVYQPLTPERPFAVGVATVGVATVGVATVGVATVGVATVGVGVATVGVVGVAVVVAAVELLLILSPRRGSGPDD